jgi:PPOX class probable F420-dependent enzyme
VSPGAVRLDERSRLILERPVVAHLATITQWGGPRVEPVWFALDGDLILITTDHHTVKAANIRRDPRVALSAVSPEHPLDHVLVRGHVVETRPDDDLGFLDSLSYRYTGGPYPRRRWSGREVYAIEPLAVRCWISEGA